MIFPENNCSQQSYKDKCHSLKNNFKRASVLPFTLVILLLMALMGVAILVNTKVELMISNNTSNGRNAFATADMAAGISTLMGRIILYPELGSPEVILKSSQIAQPEQPFVVEISNINNFDLSAIKDAASSDYRQRYIKAGSWLGRTGTEGEDLSPHLIFKIRDKNKDGVIIETVVATSFISMDTAEPTKTGMSLDGGDAYDKRGGGSLQILMAVTALGMPSGGNTATGQDSAFEGGKLDESYTIVTSIYREVM